MEEYICALFGLYPNRGGLFIELRAFSPVWTGRTTKIQVFHPLSSGMAKTIETLTNWNAFTNAHTLESYIGVLPRTGRNGTKSGITQAGFVWAEVDKGEEDTAAALRLLKEGIKRLGLPSPDVVVKSGGSLKPSSSA